MTQASDLSQFVTAASNLKLNSGIQSVDTMTGALIVEGGVGIGGNLVLGGNLTVTGTIYQSAVFNGGVLAGNITATNFLEVAGGINAADATFSGNIGVTGTTMLVGGLNAADATFSGNVGVTGTVSYAAGTTVIAPIKLNAGTNLTSAVAGAIEYDGVNFYATPDTTLGRGTVPAEQHFKLSAVGSAITTIANFFGATSSIPLVSGAYYEIEIVLFYLKTTAGTVTWTLTNSAAPTSMNVFYEMSPITGIVAPPGTATKLVGYSYNQTAASYTITTGSISNGVNNYARLRVWLQNGVGTSLQIRATAGTGSVTPGIGSKWTAKRISPNNVGTFV